MLWDILLLTPGCFRTCKFTTQVKGKEKLIHVQAESYAMSIRENKTIYVLKIKIIFQQ